MASPQWQLRNFSLPARMARQKTLDPRAPFRIEQRTGDVDDPPARPHQPGSKVEQIILRRRKPVQPRRRQPPLGLGLAPPGARARTWGIDQHAVDLSGEIGECRSEEHTYEL